MYYCIVGRIPHDEEDTTFNYETDSETDAVRLFKEEILSVGEPTEYEYGEPVVYINTIISSKTELTLWHEGGY